MLFVIVVFFNVSLVLVSPGLRFVPTSIILALELLFITLTLSNTAFVLYTPIALLSTSALLIVASFTITFLATNLIAAPT